MKNRPDDYNFNVAINHEVKDVDYLGIDATSGIEEYMNEGGPYDPIKIMETTMPLKGMDSDGKLKNFRSLFMDPQRRVVLSFEEFPISSSVERIEAFIKLGRKDPVNYAEILQNGDVLPRTWEEVRTHVKAILLTHKN
jgi:hypothetical protein